MTEATLRLLASTTLVLLAVLVTTTPASVAARSVIGDITPVARNYVLANEEFCHGQLVSVFKFPHLFAQIGYTYGGDGRNFFRLPDLRGSTVLSANETSSIGTTRNEDDASALLMIKHLPQHKTLTTPLQAAAANEPTTGLATCTSADTGCVDVYPSMLVGSSTEKTVNGVRAPGVAMHFVVSTRGIWPTSPQDSLQSITEGTARPDESSTNTEPVVISLSTADSDRLGHLSFADPTLDFNARRDIPASFATSTGDGSGSPASVATVGNGESFSVIGPGLFLAAHAGLADMETHTLGDVAAFPFSTPSSSDWLPCDGRAMNKLSNLQLFTVIGDAFGANSTHFHLPNLNGQTIYGARTDDSPSFGSRVSGMPALGWDDVPGFSGNALPNTIALKTCGTGPSCTELLNPTTSTFSTSNADAILNHIRVASVAFYMYAAGTAPSPSQCADGFYSDDVDPLCSKRVEDILGLAVVNQTLTPAFSPNVSEYTVYLPSLQEIVTINVQAPDGSGVEGDGLVVLRGGPQGETEHTVRVVAGANTEYTYSITFIQPYICGSGTVSAGERSQPVAVERSTISGDIEEYSKNADCPQGTIGSLTVTCSPTSPQWRVSTDTCAVPDCVGGRVKSRRVRVMLPPGNVGDTAYADCPAGYRGRLSFECQQAHQRRAAYRRTSGQCRGCAAHHQDTTGDACEAACQRQYNAPSRYTLIDANPTTGCKGRCECFLLPP
ncbi:hypothetical protein PTSG_05312 [Salpingoeca rosetta]|uniref:Phage tail collar domain-containing protein n=1 Tax=Salpingoeca rosetta (strain ATCC 50818 / BSB-021) TaxID=946362 RepID=F2UA27_SALR5|nr:uncharacterized protein PTSG_05312 [Salpingoeca rosetta]EGD73602.1 hypothetical protein PTSG_05312 [Salpingoeca rosetta]|eukprot:XP_004993884.1 hypothetical protein PTSG_05312 [Salpingoeca rosetta]